MDPRKWLATIWHLCILLSVATVVFTEQPDGVGSCYKVYRKKSGKCRKKLSEGGKAIKLTYLECCNGRGLAWKTKKKCTRCPVKVDGGWGKWSSWGSCSATCSSGNKQRTRNCDSPPPKNGGKFCRGLNKDKAACDTGIPCPIDGGWSEWASWGRCSVSCDFGKAERKRNCNNPEPTFGGKYCSGKRTDVKDCSTGIRCPIDGNWGPWQQWSQCTKSCGKDGKQIRSRKCDSPPPQYGGILCKGASEDGKNCFIKEHCPINGNWGSWNSWSQCSTTCNEGQMTKKRQCNNPQPQHGGNHCIGKAVETDFCQLSKCGDKKGGPGTGGSGTSGGSGSGGSGSGGSGSGASGSGSGSEENGSGGSGGSGSKKTNPDVTTESGESVTTVRPTKTTRVTTVPPGTGEGDGDNSNGGKNGSGSGDQFGSGDLSGSGGTNGSGGGNLVGSGDKGNNGSREKKPVINDKLKSLSLADDEEVSVESPSNQFQKAKRHKSKRKGH
ncbi:hemicentin-1-like [Rhopilema esculentum]|uniref:hemicentin-1-like n=1 Tax=Rhopilema esculentum TaxID=499914 RepID=UPI0031E14948